MTDLLGPLAAQAALASTVILGLGLVAVHLARAPIHRQRWGELAVGGTVLWFALAFVPLPRCADEAVALLAPQPALAPQLPQPGYDPVTPLAPQPGYGVVATATPQLPQPGYGVGTLIALAPDSAERRPGGPAAAMATASPTGADSLVASAPPGPASRAPADLILIAALIAYATGALIALAYLALGVFVLRRVVRSATLAPAWMTTFARLATERSRRVRVLIAPGNLRPLCFGLLRNTIVIPEALADRDRIADAREVLLHELAHVKRRDARGRWLFAIALPFLYPHPLYWLLQSRVRLAAEVVADDWAAARSVKHRYARALVALADAALPRGVGGAAAASMFRSKSEFYWRMKMLLERSAPLRHSCSRSLRAVQFTVCMLAVLAAVALWGTDDAVAQSDERVKSLQKEIDSLKRQVESLQRSLRAAARLTGTDLPPEPVEIPEPGEPVRHPVSGLVDIRADDVPVDVGGPTDTADPSASSNGDRIVFVPMKVKAGDTVRALFRRAGSDIKLLPHFKGLPGQLDPRRLRAGQTVLIPLRIGTEGPADAPHRSPAFETRILEVDMGTGLIVVAGGRKHGVREGMLFHLGRGGTYVGAAQVIKVEASRSTARISSIREGGMRVGDLAFTSPNRVGRKRIDPRDALVAVDGSPTRRTGPWRPGRSNPARADTDAIALVERLIGAERERGRVLNRMSGNNGGDPGDQFEHTLDLEATERRIALLRRAIDVQIDWLTSVRDASRDPALTRRWQQTIDLLMSESGQKRRTKKRQHPSEGESPANPPERSRR